MAVPNVRGLCSVGVVSFIPKITTDSLPRRVLYYSRWQEHGGGGPGSYIRKFSRYSSCSVALALTTGMLGFSGALFFLYAASKGPISLVASFRPLPRHYRLLSVIFLKETICMKQWLGIALDWYR